MQDNFFIIEWNMDVLVRNHGVLEENLQDLTMANQVIDRFRLNKGNPESTLPPPQL